MGQSISKSYPQKSRDRIIAGQVLQKLLLAFNGELEMTHSQVTIGLALLKKVLPDVKHHIHEGTIDGPDRKAPTSQIYRDILDSEKG